MSMFRRGFPGRQRHSIDPHAIVFQDGLASCFLRQVGSVFKKGSRLQEFDRQITKTRRPAIHCAMNVSRLAESHLAEFPFSIDRIAAQSFNVQLRTSDCDHDIVVPMSMPKCRIADRNGDVPNAHVLIFQLWMMARLAANFDWRLRRVGLLRTHRSEEETHAQDRQKGSQSYVACLQLRIKNRAEAMTDWLGCQ